MKKELSIMDKDLTDQYVVLKDKYYKGDEIDRVFLCKGGFGCHKMEVLREEGSTIVRFILDL